jgi:hypothetical protein
MLGLALVMILSLVVLATYAIPVYPGHPEPMIHMDGTKDTISVYKAHWTIHGYTEWHIYIRGWWGGMYHNIRYIIGRPYNGDPIEMVRDYVITSATTSCVWVQLNGGTSRLGR